MKRAMIVGMVVLLLVMMGGPAVADGDSWAFVITTADGGETFQLVYTGEDMVCDTYTFFIGFDPGGASVSVESTPPAPLSDWGSGWWGRGMVVVTVATPPRQYATLSDGMILATFRCEPACSMNWEAGISDPSFLVGISETQPGGGQACPLLTGEELWQGNHLLPKPGPVPPIPELASGMLFGVALLAFGGWVWFKRVRVKEAVA